MIDYADNSETTSYDLSLRLPTLNLAEISEQIREVAHRVQLLNWNEEQLKQEAELILRTRVWDKLGIQPKYEEPVRTIYGLRYVDALYGLTILEYKKPGTLDKTSEREKALNQVKEYLKGLKERPDVKSFIQQIIHSGRSPRLFAAIIDGFKAILVEYNPLVDEYTFSNVLDISPEVLGKIIRSVITSYRKQLDARTLAADFGYESKIAKTIVGLLYSKLLNPKSKRTELLFQEWKTLASKAYSLSPERLTSVAEYYGIQKQRVDGLKLFFAVQTYYSLIVKLVAVQVASKFYDSAIVLYMEQLKQAPLEELRNQLEFLESGGIYSLLGINNFLEGEYFSWYLDEWDRELGVHIKSLIDMVSEYDIEPLIREPGRARDLFKELYELLVPRKEVRHQLGMYTTPDWLAEFLLDKLELTPDNLVKLADEGRDPLNLKFLDPACGTGTFLVLLISRLKEYGVRKNVNPAKLLKAITQNIIGFDIDGLAVLTAKANYLIALSDLLLYKGGERIEIPIYLADSITVKKQVILPQEDTGKQTKETREYAIPAIIVKTAVGDFWIPEKLVRSQRFIEFLNKLREWITFKMPIETIISELKKTIPELNPTEILMVKEIYSRLIELESKELNRVWCGVLKTAVIPVLMQNTFDYVVGNPPWLVFNSVASPEYQEEIKELIVERYGLVTEAHLITHMELAILFLVRCAENYLKPNGKIGFLMPRSIFQADHHDALRRGSYRHVRLGIEIIIDLKDVEPLFYVPSCGIIAVKDTETKYPVKCIKLEGRLPSRNPSLDQARKHLKIRETKLYLNSIGSRSWLDENKLEIKLKRSDYYDKFYQGATIVPRGCWFVDVTPTPDPNKVYVTTSKRLQVGGREKHEISLQGVVESQFIYPVLTAAEVLPFTYLSPNNCVLPIIPERNNYRIIDFRQAATAGYNGLADWLVKVEKEWERVRGEKAKRITIYQRLDYQKGLTRQNPSKRFKVVYLKSAKHMTSCIVDNPRMIIEHTLYVYETDDLDEAMYLVAVLNSNILDELIKPMQERDIHKRPLEFPVPKFNPNNPIHIELVKLGKQAFLKASELLPVLLTRLGYEEQLSKYGALTPQQVGRLRSELRKSLKELLDQIDQLVVKLLEQPGKTSLAQWFSQNKS